MSSRPQQKSKQASTTKPASKNQDILGIVVIFFAVLISLSLFLRDSGILGSALGGFLTLLFGRGVWVISLCMALLGISMISGKKSLSLNQMSLGFTLIFLSILGIMSRPHPVSGDFFDPRIASTTGGYVGAMMGFLSQSLLGSAKVVGLIAISLIGGVLVVQSPIRALLQSFADRAKSLTPKRPVKLPKKETPVRAVIETPQETRPARESKFAEREVIETQKPEKPTPVFTSTGQAALELDINESTPKEGYKLPPLTLLSPPAQRQKRTPQEMQQNIETLESTLEEFGIEANVVEVAHGPTLTRYEIQLGPGIKVNRITSLADNMAMNLAASQVRVEAPIPGKAAIGIEVPNQHRYAVSLREVCESAEFRDHPSRLFFALGQDVSGVNRYADLTKMPHVLIGGATNSGKSIGLASFIMSILMRNTPKDVRMVMIDPKRVELSLFNDIPHLLCPVVKDVKEAPAVLRAVWREMDRRYDMLSEAGVRNIEGWNEKASFQDKMSYIVVIIDELADLMIQSAAEVETSICRLAQLARAVGIHLVIATQRPSVDVITGTIKANIPSRIAFSVSSQIDSRTILDSPGADRLIGRGDMLFQPIDAAKPLRIQGCYISEKEIEAVCNFWRNQERPHYQINPMELAKLESEGNKGERGGGSDEDDPLWEESVRWVVDRGQASTSMLQRRFSIGFQRASRLLDMMEERGIVGPRDGPRPREVTISRMEIENLFGGVTNSSAPPFDDED